VSALALLFQPKPLEARPLGFTSTTSATAIASDAALQASQQALAAAKQSQASITRALQAIQSVKAAQAAARAAAQAGGPNGVTDGLSAGGLVVDPRVSAKTDPNLWINASQPTQTTANGQTTVTIEQTAQ
jgi:hypothetical protein